MKLGLISSNQGLSAHASTHINDVGEIIDEILVDSCIGGIHAQDVLVSSFECFDVGVVELVSSLQNLLLDQFEFFRLFQLFLGDRRFEFGALRFNVAKFGFRLPVLDLIGLGRLHGRVKLVKYLEQFFVAFEAHLPTLSRIPVSHYCSSLKLSTCLFIFVV